MDGDESRGGMEVNRMGGAGGAGGIHGAIEMEKESEADVIWTGWPMRE